MLQSGDTAREGGVINPKARGRDGQPTTTGNGEEVFQVIPVEVSQGV
jgi:hypothetical protein